MKYISSFVKISFLKTIIFNFYYLPINQAIKFPIIIYSRFNIVKLSGKVSIINQNIKTGMIKLGLNIVSLYDSRDFSFNWENSGNILFYGTANIGNNSSISVGKSGNISFGNNFGATANFRIVSHNSITIGENCRFSWENIVTDSDFHTIYQKNNKKLDSKKPIKIGNDNWFGIKSMVLKGAETPDFCIIAPSSIVNKKYNIGYSLLAGAPAQIKKTDIFYDVNSDFND